MKLEEEWLLGCYICIYIYICIYVCDIVHALRQWPTLQEAR